MIAAECLAALEHFCCRPGLQRGLALPSGLCRCTLLLACSEAAGYLEMVQGTVEAAARIDSNGEGLRNRSASASVHVQVVT